MHTTFGDVLSFDLDVIINILNQISSILLFICINNSNIQLNTKKEDNGIRKGLSGIRN